MDQIKCEEDILDFQTRSAPPGVEKSALLSMSPAQKPGNRNSDLEIATQTPEKITETLLNKSKENELELPEKYKTLMDLFDAMTCSLRWLSLCKWPTTFVNICSQVEVLRKRKLSYVDLARMKYALPKALEIKRIHVHDLKTLHRPELKVSLLLNVVEGHQEHSDYIALNQLFAAKLITIATKYPEDIPLANLPEPFNQSWKTISDDRLLEPFGRLSQGFSEAPVHRDSLDMSRPASAEPDQAESSFQSPSFARHFSKRVAVDEDSKCTLLVASPKYISDAYKQGTELELVEEFHCMANEPDKAESSFQSPSFARHFSKRVAVDEDAKCTLLVAPPKYISDTSSASLNKQGTEHGLVEEFHCMANEPDICTKLDIQNKQVKESQDASSQPNISHSPLQMKSPITAVQSPVLGFASASDILMTETPAQMPPRRSVSSCDEKLKSVTRLTPSSMSAKRSLVFSNGEGEAFESTELQSCKLQDDYTSQTPMTKGFTLENVGSHHLVDQNVNTSNGTIAEEFKRSSCLSELVPIIHQIFLSVNRAAITQEELVHKILVNSVHIVERREVEEHIELLEKMLPDWLCKRLAPFGGFLYYIRRAADVSSIQARLVDT